MGEPSALELELAEQVELLGLPTPVSEHKFHATRRWRFDFAWPELMVACEVEGATWAGGRHTRGAGFQKDAEKYGEAAIAGWRVIRVTSGMIKDGMAIELLARAIAIAQQGREPWIHYFTALPLQPIGSA